MSNGNKTKKKRANIHTKKTWLFDHSLLLNQKSKKNSLKCNLASSFFWFDFSFYEMLKLNRKIIYDNKVRALKRMKKKTTRKGNLSY